MKIVLLVINSLFLITPTFSQKVIINTKTEHHANIPGTPIFIIPPESFTASSQFLGFQDNPTGSSLMVLQIPGPYLKVKEGFTKDKMSTKGMELITTERVTINNMKGEILLIRQFSAAHGYSFSKHSLILEIDENNTVLINGSFPESKNDIVSGPLRKSIESILYDKSIKADPFASLDFTVDITKSKFQLQKSISGTLSLEGSKKDFMLIAKSARPVNSSDKKGASIQILKAITTISYINLVSSKEINQDGADGYQIVANVLQNGKQIKAVQTILFGENYYYNFTALVSEYTKDISEDYDYIFKSFKRK